MKLITSLLLFSCLLWANYPLQQSYLLDPGAASIVVHNSGAGGADQVVNFAPSGSQRIRFTASAVQIPPPAASTFSSCSNPCTLSLNENWGDSYIWAEYVDSSGNSFTPAKTFGPLVIRQAMFPCASTWTLPIEVIGQMNYTTCVQVTAPGGSATTNIRLYMRVHNPGYNMPLVGTPSPSGYDGKISVRVNGGAWINVNSATCTQVDELKYYADYDTGNGPVPACSIGWAPQTIELTAPLPDNLITVGTNSIYFRFNGTDGTTSGYRVLAVNFQDTSTLTTLDSISVTSSVATATAHAATVWNTGDYWYFQNPPGIRARFGGARQLTKLTNTTATFTPCGGPTALILNGACTSPNGTYTVPNSQFPGVAMASQPVMYAIRNIIPESAFSWDNPSAWTAPAGSSVANGSTLWSSQTLVLPSAPLDYKISAKCADCHSKSGLDLQYYRYSNWAIKQRSIFHGLTAQQGDDIAAYIRSLTASNNTTARPWNPPYQPCPGLDSGSVQAWASGGGVDCILTYDSSEYLAPGGNFTSWAMGTGQINMRELPLNIPLMDWNKWLPIVWPDDGFPGGNFRTSAGYTAYQNFASAVTPGNYAAFFANSFGFNFAPQMSTYLLSKQINSIPGASGESTGWQRPSMYPHSLFSITQFMTTKQWEFAHELDVEKFLGQLNTDTYGASPFLPYIARGWQSSQPFFTGFHVSIGGSPHNPMNNSIGATFQCQTDPWYVAQPILNAGNGWGQGNSQGDYGYTFAFQSGCGAFRPNGWQVQTTWLFGPQQAWNNGNLSGINATVSGSISAGTQTVTTTTPNASSGIFAGASVLVGSGASLETVAITATPASNTFTATFANNHTGPVSILGTALQWNRISPTAVLSFGNRLNWAWLSSADRTNIATQYANALASLTTRYSLAQWQASINYPGGIGDCVGGADQAWGSGFSQLCGGIEMALPLFNYWGVPAGTVSTIRAFAQSVWPNHNFAQDVAASASGVLNISGNTATYVSGQDFTNFGVAGSGTYPIRSSLYINGLRYNITAVASNTSLTLDGSPPSGTQNYARCILINLGGSPPAWPVCGNTF